MKLSLIHQKVKENRAAFYNCSIDKFEQGGIHYKVRESNEEPDILFFTQLYNGTFITAGQHIIDKLKVADQQWTIENIKEIFPLTENLESYPHYIYTEDNIEERTIPEEYSIREMNPENHPPLQEFLDLCTPEDIDEALIDLDDPDNVIFMVYKDEIPLCYAAYRLWNSGLGDVGILTLPEHRKRGIGLAAVAQATKACIRNGHIPLYRTSYKNHGSKAIAENLSYTLFWETHSFRCIKKEQ